MVGLCYLVDGWCVATLSVFGLDFVVKDGMGVIVFGLNVGKSLAIFLSDRCSSNYACLECV